MNKNIRRFAAIFTLTLALGSTPAIAAPSRDGGDRERTPIVRVIKKVLKFFGIKTTADPSIPIPGPDNRG